MVSTRLEEMKAEGNYVGKFGTQYHFFGYEGRCAAPSNFDADYCYSLGYTASVLVAEGKTGYMSSVRNTTAPADQWIAGGVPVTMIRITSYNVCYTKLLRLLRKNSMCLLPPFQRWATAKLKHLNKVFCL